MTFITSDELDLHFCRLNLPWLSTAVGAMMDSWGESAPAQGNHPRRRTGIRDYLLEDSSF